MKKIFSLFVGVFLLTNFSLPVSALTFQSADNLVINQPILDDAYLMGGNVVIEADVNGDVFILGGRVQIDGVVEEDLFIGGGTVQVNGEVKGDVRIAGGQVTINGNIGDDLLIAGGQVDVNASSRVSGTVVAGAGVLTVNGYIGEELRGGMGSLILNGEVEGDVFITLEDTMNISENARIGGNLNYSALLEGSVPEGVVAGAVTFNQFENNLLKNLTYFFFIEKLVSFLGALILLLLAVLLMPNFLKKSALKTRENVFKSFVLGLFVLIGAFLSFIILMMTWVGIPLAILIMATLVKIFYLAKLFAVAYIGSYLLNYKKKVSKGKLVLVLSVVLLGYFAVSLMPFMGWLINIVLFLIGVGTISIGLFDILKALKKKAII